MTYEPDDDLHAAGEPLSNTGTRVANVTKQSDVATIGMHLTDTGNAERLVTRHRHEIRYCPMRKRWLFWDGTRWAWDQKGAVDQLGKQTVRAIYGEAKHARNEKHAEAIAKHAVRSERRERRAAMIALAQTEPGIPVAPSELDADPWALNVANGTIDLRTGTLRQHDRLDLITKLVPVDFVPGATSALWERFLSDATGGDAELASYLQRAVGYALQGRVTEKAFWFLYGPPDGMKSTFIDALSSALGDYAVSAAFSTWLVQTNTGGNRGDLVALLGARLVTSVEVRKGAKFDEEIIKKVTGGDIITAAAKYEAEVTFSVSFALWYAANDAPTIRDDDEGMWSRVRRIPFTHPLSPDKRDATMREQLRAPDVQRAILAWAISGCLEWQRRGLGTCAAVEASTAEYRQDMDRVAGFFTDRCAFQAGAEVTAKDLRDAYDAWCRENGVRSPLPAKDIAARLRALKCEYGRVEQNRGWKGVRLLREWEEAGTPRTPGTRNPVNSSHEGVSEKLPGNTVPGVLAVQLDAFDSFERPAVEAEGRGEL